jgi:hypothetical protein
MVLTRYRERYERTWLIIASTLFPLSSSIGELQRGTTSSIRD